MLQLWASWAFEKGLPLAQAAVVKKRVKPAQHCTARASEVKCGIGSSSSVAHAKVGIGA